MRPLKKSARQLYQHLTGEVIGLHYRWTVFRQLFLSERGVDLMNESAPRFFVYLRTDLLDALILGLGRLIDPPAMRNNRNACLEQLIQCLDGEADSVLVESLQRRFEKFKKRCKRIELWRNKGAAHKDFHLAVRPLRKLRFTEREFEEALAELRSFMNEFESAFNESTWPYQIVGEPLPEELEALVQAASFRIIPMAYEDLVFHDGTRILELLETAKLHKVSKH